MAMPTPWENWETRVQSFVSENLYLTLNLRLNDSFFQKLINSVWIEQICPNCAVYMTMITLGHFSSSPSSPILIDRDLIFCVKVCLCYTPTIDVFTSIFCDLRFLRFWLHFNFSHQASWSSTIWTNL